MIAQHRGLTAYPYPASPAELVRRSALGLQPPNILGIDVGNIDTDRNARRRSIEIEKHALVGEPGMARGFHPFSIGDISAKEIGTLDRSISRRLGLGLQSKTPARDEQDERPKNKLRLRDHHRTAVKPVLRSVYGPAGIISKRSSRATQRPAIASQWPVISP